MINVVTMPETNATEQTVDRLARLAQVTGLPDLRTVHTSPHRLERLIENCASLAGRLEPGTPIRYRVAYREYAALATKLYEKPEDHEEILAGYT